MQPPGRVISLPHGNVFPRNNIINLPQRDMIRDYNMDSTPARDRTPMEGRGRIPTEVRDRTPVRTTIRMPRSSNPCTNSTPKIPTVRTSQFRDTDLLRSKANRQGRVIHPKDRLHGTPRLNRSRINPTRTER